MEIFVKELGSFKNLDELYEHCKREGLMYLPLAKRPEDPPPHYRIVRVHAPYPSDSNESKALPKVDGPTNTSAKTPIEGVHSRKGGNRTHAESIIPQRKMKENLYDQICQKKQRGVGAKALAAILSQSKDLVALASEAGFDRITEKIVKAALQHARRRSTKS